MQTTQLVEEDNAFITHETYLIYKSHTLIGEAKKLWR